MIPNYIQWFSSFSLTGLLYLLWVSEGKHTPGNNFRLLPQSATSWSLAQSLLAKTDLLETKRSLLMTSALLLDGLKTKWKKKQKTTQRPLAVSVTSSREVNAQFTSHPECGGQVGVCHFLFKWTEKTCIARYWRGWGVPFWNPAYCHPPPQTPPSTRWCWDR